MNAEESIRHGSAQFSCEPTTDQTGDSPEQDEAGSDSAAVTTATTSSDRPEGTGEEDTTEVERVQPQAGDQSIILLDPPSITLERYGDETTKDTD